MSKAVSQEGLPAQYGKYQLLARIGVGGMAEIFRARLPGVAGFEKILVIKRLLPHLTHQPQMVEMFVNEAKLAAQVHHRNIVQVFELGQMDNGEYFIAMEHVAGTDLRQILRAAAVNSMRIPPWFSVHVVAEVLDGLAYAHDLVDDQGRERKVVHRDVTPANIFVSQLGDIKLGDFGVAKDSARAEKTRGGQLKGKVPYMSPEQLYGRALDARTDVFAAGVVLWECLTQRRLFGGRPDIEAMNLICFGDRKPPSSFAADVPPELDAIVLRALSADHAARTESAGALHAELLEVLPKLRARVHQSDVRGIVEVLLGNKENAPLISDSKPSIPKPPTFSEKTPDSSPSSDLSIPSEDLGFPEPAGDLLVSLTPVPTQPVIKAPQRPPSSPRNPPALPDLVIEDVMNAEPATFSGAKKSLAIDTEEEYAPPRLPPPIAEKPDQRAATADVSMPRVEPLSFVSPWKDRSEFPSATRDSSGAGTYRMTAGHSVERMPSFAGPSMPAPKTTRDPTGPIERQITDDYPRDLLPPVAPPPSPARTTASLDIPRTTASLDIPRTTASLDIPMLDPEDALPVLPKLADASPAPAAYEGANPFWVRIFDRVVGPMRCNDALSFVRRETKNGKLDIVAISGDNKSWMDAGSFALLTGQEILLDPSADREKEMPPTHAGSLERTSMATVFARISRERPTGRLIVAQSAFGQAVRREILLVEGKPTFVYANSDELQLPTLVIVKSILNQVQLAEALHRVVIEDRSIDDVVAKRAGLDLKRYHAVLMKERIVDLFRWKTGKFAIDLGATITHTAPFVPSMLGLVPELVLRTKTIEELRAALAPYMDARLVHSDHYARGIGELRLSELQSQVAAAFTGKTLASVLKIPAQNERLTLAVAYILIETELLQRAL